MDGLRGNAHASSHRLASATSRYGAAAGAMAFHGRDRHLAACDDCQAYLEQMRTVIRLADRPTAEAVPPETMAGLLRAFRDWRR